MPEIDVEGNVLSLSGMVTADQWSWIVEEDGSGFTPSMVRRALARVSGAAVVRLSSPGGDPYAGEQIRVLLAEHPGGVTAQVIGEAMSAASLLVMGATRIEMSAGSVMMIHDPSTLTVGNAEEHQRSTERLNAISDIYAGVYAARSGQAPDEVRQMMRIETYMGPDAAIAAGFADALLSSDLSAPAPEDAVMRRARADFHAMQRRLVVASAAAPIGAEPAATCGFQSAGTAAQEGLTMSSTTTAADAGGAQTETERNAVAAQQAVSPVAEEASVEMAADRAVRRDRERARAIRMAAQAHVASGMVMQSFVDELIDEGLSVEGASQRILAQMAETATDIGTRRPAEARMTRRDDAQTRREGLSMALTARLTGTAPEDDRARPFMDLAMHEMAAVSMGRDRPGMGSYASREDILMQAMHTTSDFPNILSTSVNRVLASNYELVDRTFTAIAREMTFNDFRPHDVVRPDEFPSLRKVNEAGEIQFGSLGDNAETVVLGAYATGVMISRQALVNDDMGAISEVIDNAAAVVPEFEEDLFWSLFLANGALADGVPMFHATHGNLAGSGGAITVDSIAAGRTALRRMKSADGKRTVKMNAPSILLVGPAKETEAEKIVREITAAKSADVNPFSGRLTVVVTEAIEDNQWYLCVSPEKRTHNWKYGYLRDRAAPRIRVDEPFGRQGVGMTLEQDFGAGGVNSRGAWKNPGN